MSSRTQFGQQELVVKGSRCEDCGNQAKKDCAYSRCRSCCKNKGFECQTHIRSTWVPVDRRRHQQQQQPLPTSNQGDIPKRLKQNSFSNMEEEFKFPTVMSSMATFSCVRVHSMDDTVSEIAYQTSVNIGGHVFSGLVYDQGPDQQSFSNIIGSRIENPLHHQQHNFNLANAIHSGATITMAPPLATPDHDLFLPPPPHPFANSLRPGMPYFSHPKC